MKNSTFLNLRNASTLEAVVTLNYYAHKERKTEERTQKALTKLSETKAILELLGLYTSYSLQTAIDLYKSLSDDDKTEFRANYGYSFSIDFYYIEDLIRRLEDNTINYTDVILN